MSQIEKAIFAKPLGKKSRISRIRKMPNVDAKEGRKWMARDKVGQLGMVANS